MAYVKTNWEDYPSTATAIDADALNHMEEGIYNNDQALGGKLDNASPSFSGNMTGSGNVTVGGEVENGNGETLHGAYQSAENVLPIDTESGNPAIITDAFGGACKSLKLTLEPIQSGSGTPSPSNVRPISGRTQSVVTRTGKNLVFKTISECNINASGTLESNNSYAIQVAYLKGGITYTLTSDENRFVGGYFSSNPSLGSSTIDNTRIISNTTTITPENDCWVAFRTYNNYATPQLEVGSTATPYEAYNGESITRTYGTTIYGGTDDVTGGGATSDTDLIDLGSLTWTYNAQQFQFYSNALVSVKDGSDLVCSCYEVDSANYFSNPNPHSRGIISGRIYIVDTNYTDPNALKTALSGMKHSYKLVTPTSIPLTAQNITLLHGDNVLTTDADSIEASYSADIALYIAKKIAEGSNNNRSVDNSSLSKGGSGDEESKEEEKEEEPKEVEVNER